MIDPKKVRLMTKLAVYEEGPGKKDLKIYIGSLAIAENLCKY